MDSFLGKFGEFWATVTWLGDFWKFLGTNFLSKVAQIFGDFLDHFENSNF